MLASLLLLYRATLKVQDGVAVTQSGAAGEEGEGGADGGEGGDEEVQHHLNESLRALLASLAQVGCVCVCVIEERAGMRRCSSI